MAEKKPTPKNGPAQDESWRERVSFGAGSIHERFEAQIRALLADADISEEDKEKILTNMSCPCCGGSAASFTVKLKE